MAKTALFRSPLMLSATLGLSLSACLPEVDEQLTTGAEESSGESGSTASTAADGEGTASGTGGDGDSTDTSGGDGDSTDTSTSGDGDSTDTTTSGDGDTTDTSGGDGDSTDTSGGDGDSTDTSGGDGDTTTSGGDGDTTTSGGDGDTTTSGGDGDTTTSGGDGDTGTTTTTGGDGDTGSTDTGGQECGNGTQEGDEVCDEGTDNGQDVGDCNEACTGYVVEKYIRFTVDYYTPNWGGAAGADTICQAKFGAGYKAMVADATRRGTQTAWVGDSPLDWVLKPYTRYINLDDALIWFTQDIPLLGATGNGGNAALVNAIHNATSGYGAWTGMTYGFVPSLNCNNWTDDTDQVWGRSGIVNNVTTFLNNGGQSQCQWDRGLYCVQQ